MVRYTSAPEYWAPLRPRIRIFAFNDKTYSDALYTYNAFTDTGTEAKPISLSFSSQVASAGEFSIEIEDSGNTFDSDIYTRGNRVFIECSKDGITWDTAFKGLIRSSMQKVFGISGRNVVLEGYSYLIRLNERVVNLLKEAAVTGDPAVYVRTDSTMFTNNLINDILTTDSNYVNSVDDTELYGFFETNNILSSPVNEWIPRLDAQFVSVSAAIDRVLETSNGLVMFNPIDDELVLYTADLVTPSTGVFMITNQRNENADDGTYTMYPLAPYQYDISYDYADAGSRLIGSIGGAGACPPQPPEAIVAKETLPVHFYQHPAQYAIGPAVQFPTTVIRNLVIPFFCVGNNSAGSQCSVYIFNNTSPDDGYGGVGSQVGNRFKIFPKGVMGTPLPSVTTHTVLMYQRPGEKGPTVEVGKWYWMIVDVGHALNSSNTVLWRTECPKNDGTENQPGRYAITENIGTWLVFNPLPGDENPSFPTRGYHKWLWSISEGPCGGPQSTEETDPILAVAHDKNMSKRLGVIEKVMTSIPSYIKNMQTLNEHMFNKLYFAAKPRFVFEFPSVSVPDKLPKAGDICTHVDTRVNVGTQSGPIQTGVINSIRYSFTQSIAQNTPLGLTELAITTTGIKRGSY